MILTLLLAAAEPEASAKPAEPIVTLKQVVVDAIRNCGKGADGEIVVCARDRGVAEGYRLPKIDPRYARAAKPSGKLDALASAGDVGQGSCSATGAAGTTGCSLAQAKAWAAWKRAQKAKGEAVFPW